MTTNPQTKNPAQAPNRPSLSQLFANSPAPAQVPPPSAPAAEATDPVMNNEPTRPPMPSPIQTPPVAEEIVEEIEMEETIVVPAPVAAKPGPAAKAKAMKKKPAAKKMKKPAKAKKVAKKPVKKKVRSAKPAKKKARAAKKKTARKAKRKTRR